MQDGQVRMFLSIEILHLFGMRLTISNGDHTQGLFCVCNGAYFTGSACFLISDLIIIISK